MKLSTPWAIQHALLGQDAAPQTNPLFDLLPMVVIMIAIFYFLIIRPQQKQEREKREMLANLSKGDEIITRGGIYGTIVGLSDETVVLRVDDNAKIKFSRAAVMQVLNQGSDE